MSWPLAFSTLGCSGLPLADVVTLAQSTGWTGLELRVAPDEPVHVGLSAAERAAARAALSGVELLAIASYIKVANNAISDEDCIADALAHAALAADLGAPYLRVFPGGTEGDDAAAVRRLSAVADRLPDGVSILLETHDSHPRGVDIARVLSQVDSDRVGAIWDVLHPWRFDEPIAVTAEAIAPYLRHVQVKDVRSPTERTPLPLGRGTVPLAELYDTLRDLDYTGYLSLEWESKWHPEAVPLAEALRVKPVTGGSPG
jgi:sugar phosphate isomerase/epimerase